MNSNSTGISTPTYNSILKNLSLIYEQSLTDGTQDWNKTVLSSNWKMGEIIIQLQDGKQGKAAYGDKVLVQLSKDLNQKYGKGFSDRNLRYMRKFYQTYRMNQIHSELSWSHYRSLLLIEDSASRNALEKKAIQGKYSQRDLLIRVKQLLASKSQKSDKEMKEESMNYRLKRPSMILHTYQLRLKFSSNLEHSVPNLDLGFSVYQTGFDKLNQFKVGSIISSMKKGSGYSFELTTNTKELFTYKAYLIKVVDGDTLHVRIDLGFSIVIEQRLRLRGLDTPELGTSQGAASKKFVESCLKDCIFLIIKTYGSDKYDRYLVDVFYLKSEMDEEKVLLEGIFLNNELLEEKMALAVE